MAAAASASEIVAGALQDHKRADAGGTARSARLVQTIIPLGSATARCVSHARYFNAIGQIDPAKGIVPDIEVLQDVPTTEVADRHQGRSLAARHAKSEATRRPVRNPTCADARNDKA